MRIRAQWAGYCQDATKGVNKVWSAAWGEDGGNGIYLANWRREIGAPMVGQMKEALGWPSAHYAKKVAEKKRKGYVEIGFEALQPEYMPSFLRVLALGTNEAITIARGGYPAFGRNKGADLPLVGLQVGLGADLDPDPVQHAEKFLALLRQAGGDYAAGRLLLSYQRTKIRLEVYAEYGRRKAQRQAAAKMLSVLQGEMQSLLVS